MQRARPSANEARTTAEPRVAAEVAQRSQVGGRPPKGHSGDRSEFPALPLPFEGRKRGTPRNCLGYGRGRHGRCLGVTHSVRQSPSGAQQPRVASHTVRSTAGEPWEVGQFRRRHRGQVAPICLRENSTTGGGIQSQIRRREHAALLDRR